MKTHEGVQLGGWVRRFLLEHLVVERNLSRNWSAANGINSRSVSR